MRNTNNLSLSDSSLWQAFPKRNRRHNFRFLLASIALVIFSSLSSCQKDISAEKPLLKENQSSNMQAKSASLLNKTGPIGVCYVEVNNHNLLNAGAYTLQNSGAQLFDIAIIFAANINWDSQQQKAVLFFNNNVTTVLQGYQTYIQPLQQKGIKVLLDVLGNHQGVGICNFQSQAAAHDFAQQLADAVQTYDLDGIDFDDEYAEYGTNGQPGANSSSFVYLVQELRSLMPNKLITFYDYGPAASRLSYNGVRVGDNVDYSWNAIYGSYSVPNVPGLTNAQLGPAATWIANTSVSTAANNAAQTVTDGYGVYLYYDLPGTDQSSYLSAISQELYGEHTILSGTLASWPPTSTPPSGAIFYQDINQGGVATQPIPKGTYTLSQLQAYGFINDWASSVTLPPGWTLTMYKDDNLTGTIWQLNASNSDFTQLSPTANDLVTSVVIQ